MPEDAILLIDAYSQIFRCFYAIRSLSNSQGMPTNAVFAFARLLLRIDKDYPANYGAMALDCGKPAFRLAIAPSYKANRPPMPEELRVQLPYIKELAEAFGWPLLVREGYEADDLIAGIVTEFNEYKVYVVSSDKDLAQLVNDRVTMLIPDPKKTGFMKRGVTEVAVKFGVQPHQIIDYLALIGDSSDNIPGITGVGPKTAANLLREHGSIATILTNPECVTNEKLRDKIVAGSKLLDDNIRLITLCSKIDDQPWDGVSSLMRRQPDWERIRQICTKMELNSILKELPTEHMQPVNIKDAAPHQPDFFSSPSSTIATKEASESRQNKFAPDLFDSHN